ncbi:MAG: hypothetical protein DHS20C18_24440 [Saprospiraceae bacterium]|nr:MAG: hypothetical protein DHS20C18_24440 [Saprospiraceae bacterium]
MKKFIHIGGDSRSGGSLLARLFDGHPNILSYPFENEFFNNRNTDLIDFSEYRQSRKFEDIEKQEVVNKIKKFAEEKLKSKQRYGRDQNHFDYESFYSNVEQAISTDKDDSEIFESIHQHFFKALLDTDYSNFNAVCNHCSRTFAGNLDQFFKTFTNGYFIHTIREPKAVCASLKNYSFFATGNDPESIPVEFNQLAIDRWLIAAYMAVKNRMKYGNRYVIVIYENLVQNADYECKKICAQIDIPFHEEMLIPKFGKEVWGGNSSFGKMPAKVSSKNLEKYKEVLEEEEQKQIDEVLQSIYHSFSKGLDDSNIMEEIIRDIHTRISADELEDDNLRNHYNLLYSRMRKMQLN